MFGSFLGRRKVRKLAVDSVVCVLHWVFPRFLERVFVIINKVLILEVVKVKVLLLLSKFDLFVLREPFDFFVGSVHDLEFVLRVRLKFVVVNKLLDVFDDAFVLAVSHDSLHTQQKVGLLLRVEEVDIVEQVLHQHVSHRRIVLS